MANYKMIAALAVKRGELDRKELANFTKEHGLTGWAPTQGTHSVRSALCRICLAKILRKARLRTL